MDFHAGETFLFPLEEANIAHLWVIATNPNNAGDFAVVSLTSLRGSQDQTLILRPGEHPFIKHETCVYYRTAEITTAKELHRRIRHGTAKMKESVSAELLSEIVKGFTASDFTKNRVRQFIKDHQP